MKLFNAVFSFVIVLCFVSGLALAAEGPCKQIKDACEKAGFVKGKAKEGTGLWVDCINPIMQGKPQPAKAKITLPTIDASVVSACKAKHPKFGEREAKKH